MSRIALDVDLHRVHAFSERSGRVCFNEPEWPWDAMLEHDQILVEVASAVDTSKKEAEAYNRRKWAIGNSIMVGRLMCVAEMDGWIDRILVSPSNLWTCGYPEKEREILTGCNGRDNHDIRACRCMLYFHSERPDKWVPLLSYYQALKGATKRSKSKRKESSR